MFSIKKQFSHDANRLMKINTPYIEGEQTFARLHTFIKNNQYNDSLSPIFKWQKSFHDHIIRDINGFNNHYNYTIFNHHKHGFEKSWEYTSLSYPELIDI